MNAPETNIFPIGNTTSDTNMLSSAPIFSALTVPTDAPEIQYQIGLYWFKRDENQKAEPWIRHAAEEGHDEAILLLRLGQRTGIF